MTHLHSDLVVHHFGRPLGEAPTIFFLHGLTDSGVCWPEAVDHWQDQYAVVSVDQRGHGGSPRFTPEQLAGSPGDVMVDDAVRLLKQLDRPVLVGHSLGGAVALAAGVRHPELVRALVLEDPAPLGPEEPQRSPQRGEEFLHGVLESLAAPDDAALYRLRKEKHPDWPESELLVTGWAERQMDQEYLAVGDIKPTARWPELFAAVSVPTLVVSGGDPDELCVDRRMEQGLAEIANPHVTLVRIEGAGHCVRRDRPARFHEVVDGWLAALG